MQLESTLAQFPLPELFAMIVSSSVTGVLEVESSEVYRLYFHDGQLSHAVVGEHTGVPAVCQLFMVKEASFCFSAGVTADEVTIWQDTFDVVEFAQNYATTWERVRPTISSLDAIPLLCQANAPVVQISETAWKALAAIDGQRSINQIAAEIGQVPLEVASALSDLVEQGVVRMTPPRPESILRDKPRAARGFFGRVLALQVPEV